MITLLLVSADDALRHRLEAALEDISLFVAATDLEAIKQLRMVDIDVAVRPVTARATTVTSSRRCGKPSTSETWFVSWMGPGAAPGIRSPSARSPRRHEIR